jgi:hypothetical protein
VNQATDAWTVAFREQGWSHPPDCPAPRHVEWVMGVYDQYGMRLASSRSITCCPDELVDLDEAARLSAAYFPGNQVHLWLDTSLAPTEHLRDMPPADATSTGGCPS